MTAKLRPQDLSVGMIALQAVVTPSGQLLAPAGTTLTKQIINKAKLYNVEFVLVDTNNPLDALHPQPVEEPQSPVAEPKATPEPEQVKKAQTRIAQTESVSQKVVQSSEFMNFQMEYFRAIEFLKETFHEIIFNEDYVIDNHTLVDSISPLFLSRNTITEMFDMLHQMHALSDSVYAHCVNVALISRMIGRWLYLEQHDLDVLTCSGLLHDIGKLAIPDSILNKPGKLTEEEFKFIKFHPKTGHEMLQRQNIDPRIKKAALMHHERYDGSGYPNALSSELLDDFAMIVAIADVYDAMTAARSYREPLCAFQVIESFEKDGYQKYHPKYIVTFLNRIANTYQSNRIILNDGRSAKIVMLNQSHLSKPIIQFDSGECLDLSTAKDLYIVKIL